LIGTWLAPLAFAGEPIEEVEVTPEEAPPPGDRALEREVIASAPVRSSEELLREMPGLHLSSHGGQGKGQQILVRGFDAAHGSDIAVSVEGVPWNEPSHVHGQGFVDLHSVPDALVRRLSLSKGASRAEVGDFGLAASANFELGLEEPGARWSLGLGTDLSADLTASWRPEGAPPGTFALAHFDGGFGNFDARGWTRANLAAGWELDTERYDARVLLLTHDGRFESPGLLRQDDFEAGEVRFWGAYPTSGGGRSQRYVAIAKAGQTGEWLRSSVTAWAGLRRHSLSYNYTGWWEFPDTSDARLQTHDALDAGLKLDSQKLFALFDGLSEVRGGVETRGVRFHQIDARADASGEVWSTPWDAHGAYLHAGAWAEAHLRFSPTFHLVPSLRRDVIRVPVSGVDGGLVGEARPWSPRAILQLGGPTGPAGHLAAGTGFRSFEARGLRESGPQPITRARTLEAGAAWRQPVFSAELASYVTSVDNEILLDHLAGRYLLGGSSRRLGAELSAEWRPTENLRFRSDLAMNHARFLASGAPVPYAPRLLWTAGAYLEGQPWGEWTLTAGLRPWFLGPRPLTDGFVARPTGAVDLQVSAARGAWTYAFEADNPTFHRWRDGEFVFPSRWELDSPASDRPARHFAAGEPPALRVSVGRSF
jgi:hypothetical protein